jgi:hypothetical protein
LVQMIVHKKIKFQTNLRLSEMTTLFN